MNPPSTFKLDRRTMLRTAAWSAPVVAVAGAAPAFAASGTPAVLAGSHLTYGRPSAAGIGQFSIAPEAQLSITNTGDVTLSGDMKYTLYYLVSAGVSLGTFTPPAPADGWTYAGERSVVGADLDLLGANAGIAIDAAVVTAYDFTWTGTLPPGISTPVYRFSPATQVISGLDVLSVVSTLLDLVLPPIGYALGRHEGSTTHNGANIEDYESISIVPPAAVAGALEVTTFLGSFSRIGDWVRVNGLTIKNNGADTLPAMDYTVTFNLDSRWGVSAAYNPGTGIQDEPAGYTAGANPVTLTLSAPAIAPGDSHQFMRGADDLRWNMVDIPAGLTNETISVTVTANDTAVVTASTTQTGAISPLTSTWA